MDKWVLNQPWLLAFKQDLGLKPEQEQVPLLLSMPLLLAQMLALDLNPLLSLSQPDKQDPHLYLQPPM